MGFYSNQKVFCNICGKEIEGELCGTSSILGKDCKVCSVECLDEFQWRSVLSLLGREYRPKIRLVGRSYGGRIDMPEMRIVKRVPLTGRDLEILRDKGGIFLSEKDIAWVDFVVREFTRVQDFLQGKLMASGKKID